VYEKVRIGYIPTRRSNFSVEEALRYKRLIRDQIDRFDAEIIDIEDINEEGLLLREEDVARVIQKMRDSFVDAVFIAHCNFGCEGAVTEVASALRVPVLLFGPRDDAPDETGMRSRDSQCGLFACGKVLRRNNVKFTYITNVFPGDRVFLDGFEKFLRVVNVVKTMKNIRILQIGPRPGDFLSVMANESELLEKFGIRVFPVSLLDLKHAMEDLEKTDEARIESVSGFMTSRYNGAGIQDKMTKRTLATMKLAISWLADQYRCN
jgi:L-fucose isomerase-like protein